MMLFMCSCPRQLKVKFNIIKWEMGEGNEELKAGIKLKRKKNKSGRE